MGWLCPTCGSENSFEQRQCQVCGSRAGWLFRRSERRAARREQRLWSRPFPEAEALFHASRARMPGAAGPTVRVLSRATLVILLLAAAACAALGVAAYRERAGQNTIERSTALLEQRTVLERLRLNENTSELLRRLRQQPAPPVERLVQRLSDYADNAQHQGQRLADRRLRELEHFRENAPLIQRMLGLRPDTADTVTQALRGVDSRVRRNIQHILERIRSLQH